jgi:hypothetical protein
MTLIDSLQNDKYINKMHTRVNSEAIRPTRKPHIARKSDFEQHNKTTAHSSFEKKAVFALPDHITEIHLDVNNQSLFGAHPIYSKANDLASSFSCSEDEPENEYEKLLFAKLLESRESEWITFMHDLNRLPQDKLNDLVKIGDSQK